MATPQVSTKATPELFNQWMEERENGSSSKTVEGNPGNVFTRISISCAEPSCDAYTAGHEVMEIDPKWTYIVLCDKIKTWVESVQKGDSKIRSNLRHCVWTNDHKVVLLKVNWSGVSGNGWSDNGETIITEKNCAIALTMMAKRNAVDNLTVTISTST